MVARQEGYLSLSVYSKVKKKVLDTIKSNGLSTNNGLSPLYIPSLMMGASGMAYQLMRLENEGLMPSVLLIE